MVIFMIWFFITVIYCWSFSDFGRSIGANTNSAIEKYSEMMVEYGGTTTDMENLGSAMSDMSRYRMFDNLSKEFRFNFTAISVFTVVYILITILCYHFAFIKDNIQ